jgi:thioredoxin-like negative regulator of GroEL
MNRHGQFGYVAEAPMAETFKKVSIKIVTANEESDDWVGHSIKNKPTIMMIFKQDCGWCQMAKPEYCNIPSYLVNNKKSYNVVAMNWESEENVPFFQEHGFSTVPQFIFWKKGAKVHQFGSYPGNGTRTAPALVAGFENFLNRKAEKKSDKMESNEFGEVKSQIKYAWSKNY